MIQACIDLKFVVFADEIDLKAHMVESHPGLYGNVKTARSLNVDFQSQLSTVDSRSTSSGSNNNNNNKRNKPRGDESSAEASSSLLTSQSNAFPALGGASGAKRGQFSSLSASFGQRNAAAASASPAESPAEIAKRRLDERVRNATNYDASKFAQFTDLLALFTNTKIDAAKLISEIKRLVPELGSPDMLEAVIGDLVKVYSNKPAKAHALKKVLEEVHLKSQFPSLGSKSAFGGLPTASGAWVSSSGAAGHVGGISSGQSREAAFPSLPSRTPIPSSKGKGQRVIIPGSTSAPVSRNNSVNFSTLSGSSLRGATTVKRASPSTSSINLSYANGSSSNNSSKSSSSSRLNANDFPSLPVAKPARISSPMQLKPREVDVDDGLTILRPSRDNQAGIDGSGSNNNNKKGKGRKKELLFHFN
ncbi:hypothetical protein D0Z00_003804 [Geotrichum galactomycetum]|uniref:Uncharacterized protein n=1 Tax=Geotrichum galactomycetum TaxID=27317 RepID=A0ACB6V075_9ASCO|nr:hypothetical protein D0Z00_003804 [Geotrichum candidum]